MKMLSILVLCLIATAASQSSCPLECSCTNSSVTCNGLSSIPTDLPLDTSKVFLQNMAIKEIHPRSFAYLSEIRYIGFVNVSVEKILPYAFVGINNTEIAFENARIDSIEELAISYIDTLRRLDFTAVLIGVWGSDAVAYIKNLQTFTFSKSAIATLHTPIVSLVDKLGFLSVYKSEIPELPAQSFSYMNTVDIFYFSETYIGSINSQAFSGITYVDNLIFYKSKVDKIGNKAFSGIMELGLLNFQEVAIETMEAEAVSFIPQLHNIGIIDSMVSNLESYAFSGLSNTSSILISNSKFKIIQSFAFFEVNTRIFHFTRNDVRWLGCGTFEELKDRVNEDFQFANVTLSCDDSICWIFHPSRSYYLDALFKDSQCNPNPLQYPRLGDLDNIPKQNLPFGCSKVDYTLPFTCNNNSRTRSYPLLIAFALTVLAWLGSRIGI